MRNFRKRADQHEPNPEAAQPSEDADWAGAVRGDAERSSSAVWAGEPKTLADRLRVNARSDRAMDGELMTGRLEQVEQGRRARDDRATFDPRDRRLGHSARPSELDLCQSGAPPRPPDHPTDGP